MRKSGILMHISSLPSDYGIGTMGKEAYKFVDFLKSAKQKCWQILPIGPTSYGDSPYQSFSTNAGNPYFIDMDILHEEGLLKKSDYSKLDWGKDRKNVDYETIYENRFKVLKIAFEEFKKGDLSEFYDFLQKNESMRYTNDEIAEMFNKCFEVDSNDLVIVKDIEVFSHCEHHLALMYNMHCHVGYIPNGKVIGLSKIARICDMVSKRLQLQERICSDIAEVIQKVCDTEDVIVVVEGEHSCMTARGIKARGAKTRTSAIRGLFDTDHELRNEFYQLIKD